MTLTQCTECSAQISDKAEKCPKCACPVAKKQDTQVIEQTSKVLKFRIAIGFIITILGFPALFHDEKLGALLIIGGLAIIIATKISIWWHRQ